MACPAETVEPPSPASPAAATPHQSDEAEPELRLGGVVLRGSHLSSSPLLPYVRLLVRLIDGFEVSLRELVELYRLSWNWNLPVTELA